MPTSIDHTHEYTVDYAPDIDHATNVSAGASSDSYKNVFF
jgi:hypothetical protein